MMECELGTGKPEFLCGHHKSWEMWDRNGELVGELCPEGLKKRGGHVRKNGFQESTDTQEDKYAEARKSEVRRCDWSMQQLPLNVTIGSRGAEPNDQFPQLGQE